MTQMVADLFLCNLRYLRIDLGGLRVLCGESSGRLLVRVGLNLGEELQDPADVLLWSFGVRRDLSPL